MVMAAFIPVVMTLLLIPVLEKEWAQNFLVFIWIGLALAACMALSFIPFFALFMIAPAIAALFQKEKVIEAMFFSAFIAVIVFYLNVKGLIPDTIATEGQMRWAQNTGLMGLAFMIIAAMYGSARSAEPVIIVKRVHDSGAEKDLLQALPGATIRISPKNDIVYSTSQALEIFGVSDLVGTVSTAALFESDESANRQILMLIDRARMSPASLTDIITVQSDIDSSDKASDKSSANFVATKKFEVTASPIGGKNIGLYAIDVTDREAAYVRMQSGIENAYQDATGKTLFFAGVSHELRTPLNAIIGFSDMMRSRLFGPLPSKYAEYADLIHNSGQHMLDLIGDVLDMTKVDAGKYGLHYSRFDIADVIRSTIKMIRPMADDADVILDAEIQTHQDLIVKADRKAVRQILLNLISNAIKFTPKGGRIVVGAKTVGGTLNLMVSDNGVGMSPEDLKVIGRPFSQGASAQTSDERGSGLGLSLVKSLVELHGGRVSFASQLGEGTTIDIYMPLEPVEDDVKA